MAVRQLVAAFLVASVCAAQRAPVVSLKPANATLAAEFTRIGFVRELADGRVLVADTKELRLVAADLSSGRLESVGRAGAGPGEFRNLGRVLALPGDSTLVVDWLLRRWLLLHGARVVQTIPAEDPALVATRVMALSADQRGRVLSLVTARPAAGRRYDPLDSLRVILVARSTGRVDTVARARSQYERGTAVRYPSGGVEVSVPPIAVGEQALLFPDGWVAIARLDPWRVEWRSPDGRSILGPALPFTARKVDDREKRAFLDRQTREWGRAETYGADAWPEVLPPFERDALLAAPDGSLLVLRMPSALDTSTRYDVVDRRGALTGVVTLRANEKIVGFGAKSVYVVATDDDGIQRLTQHPWP